MVTGAKVLSFSGQHRTVHIELLALALQDDISGIIEGDVNCGIKLYFIIQTDDFYNELFAIQPWPLPSTSVISRSSPKSLFLQFTHYH